MDNLIFNVVYLTDKIHYYIFAQNSRIIYYEIMVKLKDGFTGERALVLPRIIVDKMEEDPLTSMLHITDIGYYPKAKHHFRERKEPINQYVFIYCIDGAGWYRIGNQEYTVSANQYFILPAGVPILMLPTNRAMDYLLDSLQRYSCSVLCQRANRPMDIQPEQHSRISTRINLFEEIFNTLKNGYSNENLRYAFSLCFIFIWEHYDISNNFAMQLQPMRQQKRENVTNWPSII